MSNFVKIDLKNLKTGNWKCGGGDIPNFMKIFVGWEVFLHFRERRGEISQFRRNCQIFFGCENARFNPSQYQL
jgi:hypothetical protein